MLESDASLLAPLAGFYAAAGRALPAVQTVAGTAMPRVLAKLLSAPEPLTPRLELHCGETLALRVLERRQDGDRYARCVVLVRSDGTPAVLGAIAIDLARLPAPARDAVLAETVPFGRLLEDAVAPPDALLRVTCDPFIAAALALTDREIHLYGRRRTLTDDAGATIATIVEILAPEPDDLAQAAGR